MGYKFSLVLSREITDDEVALLLDGHSGATLAADRHPANADIPVTRIDFDDTMSPSLEEALNSSLEAVGKVPDLSVPALDVPAQPACPPEEAEEPSAADLDVSRTASA